MDTARRRAHMVAMPLRTLVLTAFGCALAAVAYLSLAPGGTLPGSNEVDKPLHVLGYFGLMALAGLGVRGWRGRAGLAAGLALYGLGLEVAQSFAPQHQTSAVDMAANLLGLALAGGVLWGLDRLGSWWCARRPGASRDGPSRSLRVQNPAGAGPVSRGGGGGPTGK